MIRSMQYVLDKDDVLTAVLDYLQERGVYAYPDDVVELIVDNEAQTIKVTLRDEA